jgi:hypothetical protein
MSSGVVWCQVVWCKVAVWCGVKWCGVITRYEGSVVRGSSKVDSRREMYKNEAHVGAVPIGRVVEGVGPFAWGWSKAQIGQFGSVAEVRAICDFLFAEQTRLGKGMNETMSQFCVRAIFRVEKGQKVIFLKNVLSPENFATVYHDTERDRVPKIEKF